MNLEVLGIPKAKINQFDKKGIKSVEGLTEFLPRKYYDFRKVTPINKLLDGDITSVVGVVLEVSESGNMIRAKIKDSSGHCMYAVWFHQKFLKKLLTIGVEYIFCGKIQINPQYRSTQMVAPYYFSKDIEEYQKIIPIYSKIKGMSDDYLLNSINTALALVNKSDYLEPKAIKDFDLVKKSVALRGIHQPKDEKDYSNAKKRLVFDDLFEFCMQLEDNSSSVNNSSNYKMEKDVVLREFLKSLPFELTDGQRLTLREIYTKMKTGERVNALVQGDVGSGKTIVAIILMILSSENGYQSALMTPTNVLARQHYEELLERTKDLGIKVVFLSGEMKAKEKREALKLIETGEANMIVGTHAVISKDVKYHKLALTIVDEEHRFGVAQRNQLKEKAKEGVHNITMSATPIPRTLALTVYGSSIDIHTIKSLPKGRKPIKTAIVTDDTKAYNFMYKEIKEGRQCYIVCPLIEDSEYEGLADVDSVETTYKKVSKYFKDYPEIKISMITGKMKQAEVQEEIGKFSKNEYQIIISTTIIEVGVNVPNSTVIAIKNAERFGLSQLHQLRGRVGRGNHQSYCVLISEKSDNLKLEAMCETTDGFKIAEIDLKLRGTGDFIGTKQSGQNKYVMLMLSYPAFYEKIKNFVKEIYADEEKLKRYYFLREKDISDK